MKKKSLIASILVIVLFYFMGCDNSQNEDFENNFQSRPMTENGTLLFDGKENVIVEKNNFSDILYKNISLEIVFNQGDETGGNYQCLFYCQQIYENPQSSGEGFFGYILDHKFYFVYYDDYHQNVIECKSIFKGDCNHISIVKNADIVSLYLNGELVNIKRFVLGDEYLDLRGAPFIFGSHGNSVIYGGYRGFYYGAIDEFRFWDYDLSSEDVLHGLFREIDSDNDHLIAHYKFQNNGQVVRDYSFNNNDGFLGINANDTELDPVRVGNICME